MSDTLMRQWSMLRFVPRHPKKMSTLDMQNSLANVGFKISQRSIQRDLMTLSDIFPLVCDERSKPYGWSWMHDGEVMDIPGMDAHTALAFWLAEQHLEPLLPKPTEKRMRPHFKAAANVLDSIPANKGAPAWRNKVRVLQRGPKLVPPVVSELIQNAVYDALLLNQCIRITYSARNSHESGVKEYEANPLGLVLKDGVTYLVCSLWNYDDIRYLPLHRMKSAEIIDKPSSMPEGFDLDEYIATGVFGYMQGDNIKLKARFLDGAAFHLNERPLSDDQKLVEQSDGSVLVTATVRDNAELIWWFLGFGGHVEVLSPKKVREELTSHAKAMYQIYS